MADEAAKKTALENHLKEDWRTVHDIWPNVAPGIAKSGTMRVASDVANSTQTMANVTGLTFNALAGKTYSFRFVLEASSTAAACGLFYQFTGPASPTKFRFRIEFFAIGPTLTHEEISGFSTPTSNPSQLTANKITIIEGIFINGVNAGAMQMQFRCEAAAETVTIGAGSNGEWRLLN